MDKEEADTIEQLHSQVQANVQGRNRTATLTIEQLHSSSFLPTPLLSSHTFQVTIETLKGEIATLKGEIATLKE